MALQDVNEPVLHPRVVLRSTGSYTNGRTGVQRPFASLQGASKASALLFIFERGRFRRSTQYVAVMIPVRLIPRQDAAPHDRLTDTLLATSGTQSVETATRFAEEEPKEEIVGWPRGERFSAGTVPLLPMRLVVGFHLP
jgi:hypothetical protein